MKKNPREIKATSKKATHKIDSNWLNDIRKKKTFKKYFFQKTNSSDPEILLFILSRGRILLLVM